MAKRKEFSRVEYEKLRAQLINERSSFIALWQDSADFLLPKRPKFFVEEENKGTRKNQKIIDSTGTKALRTLRSGMMSGVTSPARPWFRLTTGDQKLDELGAVKGWLYETTRAMSTVFLQSNLYNVLPIAYGDLGAFGTAAILMEADVEDIIRFYSIPIGSFAIACDKTGKVNTFVREFRMTVGQVVDKFAKMKKDGSYDFSNISLTVRNLFEENNTEAWVNVVHIIKPNLNFNPNKLASKYKRFVSCYYEMGSDSNGSKEDIVLSEKGYDFFPVLAPRWEVSGGDIYGTSYPGVDAIGDVKALQVMQKKKLKAVDKMVDPPVVMPTALKNTKHGLLPGEVIYSDADTSRGVRTAYEVNPRIQEILLDIQDHRARIRSVFYEDLFLMLANTDRKEITAREIDARYEEKLLALGPVLEQLNQDLLNPLIDNAYVIMEQMGLVPEVPEAVANRRLRVEYVSIMAQAQKLVGISGVERFFMFANQLASVNPQVLDKIDMDQAIDVYSDMVSLPPGIVVPDDKVQEKRAQRQRQIAQQQAAQAAPQMAQAAKSLSETNTSSDNGLTKLMRESGVA